MGENRNRIDGQIVLFMESGKIAVHAPGKASLGLSLVFSVHQAEGVLASEPGSGQDVDFVTLAGTDISEHFLIQETDSGRVQLRRQCRNEQLQKLTQQRRWSVVP